MKSSRRSRSSSSSSSSPTSLTSRPPDQLVLVSWNIDGLDQHNLKKRTKAVAMIVEQEKADIVFLQEVLLATTPHAAATTQVIPETFSYLETKLPGYQCLAGGRGDYFCATLLR